MQYTQYLAGENEIYVHKEKEFLFGKVIIITPDDDYTIEDFELVDEEEYMNEIKNKKEN
jgi:hypothetical protein